MSISDEIPFGKEGEEAGERQGKFAWAHKLYLPLTIILVSTLSFGLGRLSMEGKREGVRIEYDATISNQAAISNVSNNENSLKTINSKIENSNVAASIVASKNGSKYHYPHCPGAKQIKEANKITFSTPAEAEGAGYTLAANCKP